MMRRPMDLAARAVSALDLAAPLVDLGVRLYIADVFWKSGLTKILTWDSTLYLFNEVYHVPLLPPALAAWLATIVELGGSTLLALGLAGRVAAAALLGLDAVAVISYPDLSEAAVLTQIYWGLFLLLFVAHGPGKLSLDHLLRRRFLKTDAETGSGSRRAAT